jgi:EAL domain-containing protein (putative c-di-GMP-specific phosphodiesterase class I)
MRASVARRLRTEAALRRAVDGDELEIHLQPIVALDGGGAPAALEALVRWRHPERGLLAPGEFLDVAHDAGLAVALGRRVLEQACVAAAADGVRVHVNLSARQLQDPALPETVQATLAATGAAAELLAFEVTAMAPGDRFATPVRALERLRELGAGVLLDRFGTGASALSHLVELPVEGLKIDRALVAGLREGGEPIVDAVLRLARALGLAVIAVGVEEPEQLDALRRLGCPLGQGFLLGAPAPWRGSAGRGSAGRA